MQNPPRRIQKGAVEAGSRELAGYILCRKALQVMGCIMAAERDEAASGDAGARGGWRYKRVRRGNGGMAAR